MVYGGKLRKVKFQYTGFSVEAVLDRLPTAQIISEEMDTVKGIRERGKRLLTVREMLLKQMKALV